MSDQRATVSYCASCGAENLGTRFCENCGAPSSHSAPVQSPAVVVDLAGAAEDTDAVVPLPALGAPGLGAPRADTATPFRVIAVITYLIGALVVGILEVTENTGSVPYGAVNATEVVFAAFVGLFMLLAAAVGKASDVGKFFSIILALCYPGAVALSDYVLGPSSNSDVAYTAQAIIAPAILLLVWGTGRPFRGGGYAGLLLVIVVSIMHTYVSPVIGTTAWSFESLKIFDSAIGLVVVVQASLGFDGVRPGIRRTNGAARASLCLILLTFLLNSTAGRLGSAGVAGIVAVIFMLLLAIVLGHVGYVTAGRRQEAGRGLAITSLILSYTVGIATIAIVVWLLSIAAALSAAYG